MSDKPAADGSGVCAGLDIAIIGMTGRFPGSRNLEEFWRNLRDGIEAITSFTDGELIAAGVKTETLKNTHYVKRGAALADAELFDARLFDFNPREAEIMDPQHRIFLECAWEAMEQAGYAPDLYSGLIGVFAGAGMNEYLLSNLLCNGEIRENVSEYQLALGNDKDFLPTRVSYKLNLRGPSVSIQTACSTSLVAVHMACHSLLSYQCDVALAGGISIQPQKKGYIYQVGGILSPDGHCRAFDKRAEGTIGASGVGVVVLKRLSDAVTDGDTVYAVIKGSAINNDGALKVGYTAPSVDGQAEAIATAQAVAAIAPETISYIEAHGTGTAVGDPIEITALTEVFRRSTIRKGFCAIGSVKTNIGHTDVAAGVAGLIKTVLALKHKEIPPSLHFEEPNPQIDFANSPFYVNTKLSEWKTNGYPRRAGVSSFGIGGTNAHVVLEEAPEREMSSESRPWQLLLISAKTATALDTATANLARHLRDNPDVNLADVSYTLQVGRKAFDHRRTVVCSTMDDAVNALEGREPRWVFSAIQERRDRPVAFMFPGQGSQYVQMGRDLYMSEPIFRKHVDSCAELLKAHLKLDIRDVLYPDETRNENGGSVGKQELEQTWLAQPALFVVEYALAKLWMEWGIKPRAMIGHSVGEYVAACLAGVFSLEDALALLAARGRLMQSLPGGAMLSVGLGEEKVRPFLGAQLSVAAINGPGMCVIAGPITAVEALEAELNQKEVTYQRLHTSHAFHSAMMDPILNPFTSLLEKIKLRPPTIPYVSNVSGTWISATDLREASYWARHLRQAVRFAEGVRELLKDPHVILLEVGPGQSLTTLARLNLENTGDRAIFSSLPRAQDVQSDAAFMLRTLGQLWLAGASIKWSGFYAHERRRRLALPTYPFEHQRYWVESGTQAPTVGMNHGTLRKRSDINSWLYVPSWKRTDLPPLENGASRIDGAGDPPLCVIGDGYGLGSRLANALKRLGRDVVTVTAGNRFEHVGTGGYTIRPDQWTDYDKLITSYLQEHGRFPATIIHLWNVSANNGAGPITEREAGGFSSLMPLVQSLARQNVTSALRIMVVSTSVHEVTGDELISPDRATLLGLCKVVPQEYPNIICQSVDIIAPESDSQADQLVDQLLAEISTPVSDVTVAYRGRHRWVQAYEPARVSDTSRAAPRLRQGGVYLITGGLGRIGLVCAEYLARKAGARLVLTGRSKFPVREDWDRWLASYGQDDEVSRKIARVKAIEALGAEVMVSSVDATDMDRMTEVLREAQRRFGRLHGVIHCAGIVDKSFFREITEITEKDVDLHYEPKARGVRVLEALLKEQELDFCLLQSSLSAVLGGLGMAAYAAANVYMDVFAQGHNRTSSAKWISVNWDGWDFEASAAHLDGPTGELWLTPKEGEAILDHVLNGGITTQVVISTGDLQGRLGQWVRRESAGNGSSRPGVTSRHVRPNLQTAYAAPGSELEREIANMWQNVLGIERIGIHDDFFELGGHSLLATQVVSRIRDGLKVTLALRALFEKPTVAALAERIETILWATRNIASDGPMTDREEIEL